MKKLFLLPKHQNTSGVVPISAHDDNSAVQNVSRICILYLDIHQNEKL